MSETLRTLFEVFGTQIAYQLFHIVYHTVPRSFPIYYFKALTVATRIIFFFLPLCVRI